MLNTLYKKLALTLFVIVCSIELCFLLLIRYATDLYQQEVSQKLNTQLADNILSEKILLKNGKINDSGLQEIIHMLMVINPSIEVYVVNKGGHILAYSAPEEKIKRTAVSLEPIQRFLKHSANYPIRGDDPRNLGVRKVFSAAPIVSDNGVTEGYLYVILASEAFDNVTDMIKNSFILKISVGGVIVGVAIALLVGLLFFSLLTKRLRNLSQIMSGFLGASAADTARRYRVRPHVNDEVESLGRSFNSMADKISAQISELKSNDAKRRELIANVSHDLRTPLTSLHGYIETLSLKEDQLSAEQRKHYLNIVLSHSKRLNQLITELFELAKLDSVETLLNVEAFSLAELIQDVTQKYRLNAQNKNILINMDCLSDIPFAYGDIGLIQRVLENLIDNAIRHTPAGGKITLSLSDNKDNIIVKVADTGSGIPADDLPHIFERFFRSTKEPRTKSYNSGLGLAIAKRILALHGSDITAKSELAKGTTFSFQLPTYQSFPTYQP